MNKIQQLIKDTGGLNAFCVASAVPNRTARYWESGERVPPGYQAELIRDALNHRGATAEIKQSIKVLEMDD